MGRDRVYEKAGERLPILNGDLVIILVSIFFVMFGGYFYSYRGFESYILSKRELEDERIRLKTAEVRLKKLERELESKKIKSPKEEAVKDGQTYFKSISEFKEKIDDFLKSKEIEVVSIAAQEKEDERVYLAYSLEGKEEDLFQLLERLETQHEAFTLLNSPIKMTEKNMEIKIGGYFKEERSLEENKKLSRKTNVFSKREIKTQYYPMGREKGIVILIKEGEYPKRILVQGEMEVEYGGEVYRLKIEKGGLKIQ